LYWLAINVFTMAQQAFLYRRYGLIGPKSAAAPAVIPPPIKPNASKNVTPKASAASGTARNGRAKKRSLKR
jgi:membrane protein insertase Oxa1/YidC/SpoIIIJ